MTDNKKWAKNYLNFSDRDLDYNRNISIEKAIDMLNDYESELKKKLTIPIVSKQRELLIAFHKSLDIYTKESKQVLAEYDVNNFLSNL